MLGRLSGLGMGEDCPLLCTPLASPCSRCLVNPDWKHAFQKTANHNHEATCPGAFHSLSLEHFMACLLVSTCMPSRLEPVLPGVKSSVKDLVKSHMKLPLACCTSYMCCLVTVYWLCMCGLHSCLHLICRPWPKKVGPFDHTPKLPMPGAVLPYWQTEEGLQALEQKGEELKKPLTRHHLSPPREAAAASAGRAPLTYCRTVHEIQALSLQMMRVSI